MRFYSSIQKVEVDRHFIRQAWEFAKAVTSTIDYSDSNQKKISKIQDDHFVSKIGEEAAKLVLSAFAKVQGPDYKIYEGKKKSWDDDILVNGTGIAVKTQRRTNAHKFTLSWTFQCGDKRKDVILGNPEAWVVFVEYDDLHPYTCYVYPPYQVKELMFKEPKLEYLKGSKKVVYADTLSEVK